MMLPGMPGMPPLFNMTGYPGTPAVQTSNTGVAASQPVQPVGGLSGLPSNGPMVTPAPAQPGQPPCVAPGPSKVAKELLQEFTDPGKDVTEISDDDQSADSKSRSRSERPSPRKDRKSDKRRSKSSRRRSKSSRDKSNRHKSYSRSRSQGHKRRSRRSKSGGRRRKHSTSSSSSSRDRSRRRSDRHSSRRRESGVAPVHKLPSSWQSDREHFDVSKPMGLTLPRTVQPTKWSRPREPNGQGGNGTQGMCSLDIKLVDLVYMGVESYEMRHFAHGKWGIVKVCRPHSENHLVTELFKQTRWSQAIGQPVIKLDKVWANVAPQLNIKVNTESYSDRQKVWSHVVSHLVNELKALAGVEAPQADAALVNANKQLSEQVERLTKMINEQQSSSAAGLVPVVPTTPSNAGPTPGTSYVAPNQANQQVTPSQPQFNYMQQLQSMMPSNTPNYTQGELAQNMSNLCQLQQQQHQFAQHAAQQAALQTVQQQSAPHAPPQFTANPLEAGQHMQQQAPIPSGPVGQWHQWLHLQNVTRDRPMESAGVTGVNATDVKRLAQYCKFSGSVLDEYKAIASSLFEEVNDQRISTADVIARVGLVKTWALSWGFPYANIKNVTDKKVKPLCELLILSAAAAGVTIGESKNPKGSTHIWRSCF